MKNRRKRVAVDDEGTVLTIHEQAAIKAHLEKHESKFIHPYLRMSIEREDSLLDARAKLLLLLVGETHSVRKASEMMALSPSKAWNTFNKLEDALGYAIIERRQGGKHGSGSDLTPKGWALLRASQMYEERMLAYAYKQFGEIFYEGGILVN